MLQFQNCNVLLGIYIKNIPINSKVLMPKAVIMAEITFLLPIFLPVFDEYWRKFTLFFSSLKNIGDIIKAKVTTTSIEKLVIKES